MSLACLNYVLYYVDYVYIGMERGWFSGAGGGGGGGGGVGVRQYKVRRRDRCIVI